MTHIPDDIRTCTHCGTRVSHFTTEGKFWTPWRHLAACGKQCDPGGSETMGKDGGHSSMTKCDDPKCPVVLALVCGKCGKPPGDHWRNLLVEVPGGQKMVLVCSDGQGEYEEAKEASAG